MIDLDHNLLAARQEIVFGESVAMRDLIELVAAGNVLHCSVRLGSRCEGHPRRHDIGVLVTRTAGNLRERVIPMQGGRF
jgi:hypothetical protein